MSLTIFPLYSVKQRVANGKNRGRDKYTDQKLWSPQRDKAVMIDNVITGFIFRFRVEGYGLRVNELYQNCRAKFG